MCDEGTREAAAPDVALYLEAHQAAGQAVLEGGTVITNENLTDCKCETCFQLDIRVRRVKLYPEPQALALHDLDQGGNFIYRVWQNFNS